jgi:hypothetical protein
MGCFIEQQVRDDKHAYLQFASTCDTNWGTLKPPRCLQTALQLSQHLKEEGFTTIRAARAAWPVDVQAVHQGVLSLVQHGWPPTCILMFDEAWDLLCAVSHLMFRGMANMAVIKFSFYADQALLRIANRITCEHLDRT